MDLIKDKMDQLFSHCGLLRESFQTTMNQLKVWRKIQDYEILEEFYSCLRYYVRVLKYHLMLVMELQDMLDLSLGGHVAP